MSQVSQSNSRKVLLRSVNINSSGLYRCEVSAEAPSFASAQSEGRMEIVGEFSNCLPQKLIDRPFACVNMSAFCEKRIDARDFYGQQRPAYGCFCWFERNGATPLKLRAYQLIIIIALIKWTWSRSAFFIYPMHSERTLPTKNLITTHSIVCNNYLFSFVHSSKNATC